MENWWLKMIWVHCAALRYMLCILPQTGYIFPDEFFQSPEIMAGDLLDIASYRTWEWDSSKPARNIVFPLVSSGIPYMVMRYLSGIFGSQNIITPYTLLLGPRLWMTTLSFVVDYLIYRLAVKCYNGNTVVADVAVNLFATSYTCWVFCTRTFSNTAELLLLAILLNLVVIPIGKEHNVKNIFDMNAKATLVALTTMAAFFIRTSFIAFALFPIGMWVFQNVSFSNNPREMLDTFLRVFALYPGFVIAAVGFAFCDGIYFNHNSTQMFPLNSLSLHNVSRWITELPWTPINILKYNFNDSLLEQHGKHPYYTHTVLNIQLMFGPLAVIMLKSIYDALTKQQVNKRIFYLLLGTLCSGLFFLSCIQHQEPRFILPILFPLVILCANSFHPINERKILIAVWLLFNTIGFMFFGVVHQGGVIPAMEYIHSVASAHRNMPNGNGVQFVFYKTYMPPYHLTAWPANSFNQGVHHVSKANKVLNILDLAGSSHKDLRMHLHAINSPSFNTYLVVPNTLPCSQMEQLRNEFKLDNVYSYFPHFSSENLPYSEDKCSTVNKDSNPILETMSLKIFQVTPKVPISQRYTLPNSSPVKTDSIVEYTISQPKINTSKL